jgi:phenylpropionate dioxygenase-like ring-hydroxylating dioxygenase large terminal subunit
MLTTQQKTLRRFWYATVRLDALAGGPKPFRLMGEDLVLFLDADGAPAALKDQCRHRTARLSLGYCEAGRIVCGYHGWTYERDGALARIPQQPEGAKVPDYPVQAFACQARYGYAWVALDAPISPLFDIPEDGAPGYRRIFQFHDEWRTAPLRMMENSFDNAHFAYVHKATFGVDQGQPSVYDLEETDYGFRGATVVPVVNPPSAHQVTGATTPTTTRTMENHWHLPFARRMDMAYPSGVRHIIINALTPIDDDRIQVVQLLYRNDTEADCPEQKLIDWDAAIIEEDRAILESTCPDAPLNPRSGLEVHMASDRPGVIIRHRLAKLLADHGEAEVTRYP